MSDSGSSPSSPGSSSNSPKTVKTEKSPAPAPAPKRKAAVPTQFHVQYCSSWDGGDQERRAAIAAIQSVFPTASVTASLHRAYPNTVIVGVGTAQSNKHLVTVKQRDLYAKYRHPAKKTIVKALTKLKM